MTNLQSPPFADVALSSQDKRLIAAAFSALMETTNHSVRIGDTSPASGASIIERMMILGNTLKVPEWWKE